MQKQASAVSDMETGSSDRTASENGLTSEEAANPATKLARERILQVCMLVSNDPRLVAVCGSLLWSKQASVLLASFGASPPSVCVLISSEASLQAPATCLLTIFCNFVPPAAIGATTGAIFACYLYLSLLTAC